LHGFNDYRAAFGEFGTYASTRGVLVEAYDQPGFGERRDRGRWQGADAMVAELRSVLAEVRARYPGKPIFVLGESMGAAVAIAALTRPDPPSVDGLILVAPAVWTGDDLPAGYRTALRLIAGLVPALQVSGRHLDLWASDNIEMLRALGRDPLYVRETRIDAVAGLVELMDEAREAAPKLTLPTLVLLGARDQIVPPPTSRSFLALLETQPCSAVAYLNGWHLLLRDHQRQRVFEDVLAWTGGDPPPSRLDRPCRLDAVS
jgi:alpha-beta hydrolase superfamily lysophospholipase